MCPSRHNPVYSEAWGRKTVKRFLESYARATWNFAAILEFSNEKTEKMLIFLIRHDQRKWELAKRIIKVIDRRIKEGEIPIRNTWSPETRAKYLTSVCRVAQNEIYQIAILRKVC